MFTSINEFRKYLINEDADVIHKSLTASAVSTLLSLGFQKGSPGYENMHNSYFKAYRNEPEVDITIGFIGGVDSRELDSTSSPVVIIDNGEDTFDFYGIDDMNYVLQNIAHIDRLLDDDFAPLAEEIATMIKDRSLDKDDEIEHAYGKDHLKQQGVTLGEILTSIDQLIEGNTYCIVDLGLNEWNGGYEYIGYNDFGGQPYHQFTNTLAGPGQDLGEPDMFTEEEVEEMIDNAQIAYDMYR